MPMMESLLIHLARIERLKDRLLNEEKYLYSTEASTRALRQCKPELDALLHSLPNEQKNMLGEYTSHMLGFLEKLAAGNAQ